MTARAPRAGRGRRARAGGERRHTYFYLSICLLIKYSATANAPPGARRPSSGVPRRQRRHRGARASPCRAPCRPSACLPSRRYARESAPAARHAGTADHPAHAPAHTPARCASETPWFYPGEGLARTGKGTETASSARHSLPRAVLLRHAPVATQVRFFGKLFFGPQTSPWVVLRTLRGSHAVWQCMAASRKPR